MCSPTSHRRHRSLVLGDVPLLDQHCSNSTREGLEKTPNKQMRDVFPGSQQLSLQVHDTADQVIPLPGASLQYKPHIFDDIQIGGLCWPSQYRDIVLSLILLCQSRLVYGSIVLLQYPPIHTE